MSLNRLLAGWVVVLGFVSSSPVALAAEQPLTVVQGVVGEVMAVLRSDNAGGTSKREQVRAIIAPHFDFRAMSRSILGRHWKKTSREQQDRFVELFSDLLENTYLVAMDSYKDQTVEYGNNKVDGKRGSVEVLIVDGTVKTPVIYRMRLKGETWLVYDVLVEGVSLISNYRTSFRSIVKRQGMDALLAQLEEKVKPGPSG